MLAATMRVYPLQFSSRQFSEQTHKPTGYQSERENLRKGTHKAVKLIECRNSPRTHSLFAKLFSGAFCLAVDRRKSLAVLGVEICKRAREGPL